MGMRQTDAPTKASVSFGGLTSSLRTWPEDPRDPVGRGAGVGLAGAAVCRRDVPEDLLDVRSASFPGGFLAVVTGCLLTHSL